MTQGWTEVNNGEGRRRLTKDWPEDFKLDVAVDGNIIKTYNYDEMKEFGECDTSKIPSLSIGSFIHFYFFPSDHLHLFPNAAKEMAHNEAFYPLVDDENIVPGNEAKEVELGLRIRSDSSPFDAAFGLTHIYYA